MRGLRSTIVATENQLAQEGSTSSPNGTGDIPPAEKAALLSKGVWLIYQQIAKLARVIGPTDTVKM